MKVQEKNLLSPAPTDMEPELITINPLLLGKCLSFSDEKQRYMRRLLGEIVNRRDEVLILLRDEEEMCGRLRMNILEGQNIVVLVDDLRGNLPTQNLVKNRLLSHKKKRQRECTRPSTLSAVEG